MSAEGVTSKETIVRRPDFPEGGSKADMKRFAAEFTKWLEQQPETIIERYVPVVEAYQTLATSPKGDPEYNAKVNAMRGAYKAALSEKMVTAALEQESYYREDDMDAYEAGYERKGNGWNKVDVSKATENATQQREAKRLSSIPSIPKKRVGEVEAVTSDEPLVLDKKMRAKSFAEKIDADHFLEILSDEYTPEQKKQLHDLVTKYNEYVESDNITYEDVEVDSMLKQIELIKRSPELAEYLSSAEQFKTELDTAEKPYKGKLSSTFTEKKAHYRKEYRTLVNRFKKITSVIRNGETGYADEFETIKAELQKLHEQIAERRENTLKILNDPNVYISSLEPSLPVSEVELQNYKLDNEAYERRDKRNEFRQLMKEREELLKLANANKKDKDVQNRLKEFEEKFNQVRTARAELLQEKIEQHAYKKAGEKNKQSEREQKFTEQLHRFDARLKAGLILEPAQQRLAAEHASMKSESRQIFAKAKELLNKHKTTLKYTGYGIMIGATVLSGVAAGALAGSVLVGLGAGGATGTGLMVRKATSAATVAGLTFFGSKAGNWVGKYVGTRRHARATAGLEKIHQSSFSLSTIEKEERQYLKQNRKLANAETFRRRSTMVGAGLGAVAGFGIVFKSDIASATESAINSLTGVDDALAAAPALGGFDPHGSIVKAGASRALDGSDSFPVNVPGNGVTDLPERPRVASKLPDATSLEPRVPGINLVDVETGGPVPEVVTNVAQPTAPVTSIVNEKLDGGVARGEVLRPGVSKVAQESARDVFKPTTVQHDPTDVLDAVKSVEPTPTPEPVPVKPVEQLVKVTNAGDRDTLSEAMYEAYKSGQLKGLENIKSNADFLKALWPAIEELDNNKVVMEAMHVSSGDLDVVHAGQEYNVQPLIDHMNKVPVEEIEQKWTPVPESIAPATAIKPSVAEVYTVEKNDNFWDVMEGDTSAKQPEVFDHIDKKNEQALIDLVRDEVNTLPQGERTALGFGKTASDLPLEVKNADGTLVPNKIPMDALNKIAVDIAQEKGWITDGYDLAPEPAQAVVINKTPVPGPPSEPIITGVDHLSDNIKGLQTGTVTSEQFLNAYGFENVTAEVKGDSLHIRPSEKWTINVSLADAPRIEGGDKLLAGLSGIGKVHEVVISPDSSITVTGIIDGWHTLVPGLDESDIEKVEQVVVNQKTVTVNTLRLTENKLFSGINGAFLGEYDTSQKIASVQFSRETGEILKVVGVDKGEITAQAPVLETAVSPKPAPELKVAPALTPLDLNALNDDKEISDALTDRYDSLEGADFSIKNLDSGKVSLKMPEGRVLEKFEGVIGKISDITFNPDGNVSAMAGESLDVSKATFLPDELDGMVSGTASLIVQEPGGEWVLSGEVGVDGMKYKTVTFGEDGKLLEGTTIEGDWVGDAPLSLQKTLTDSSISKHLTVSEVTYSGSEYTFTEPATYSSNDIEIEKISSLRREVSDELVRGGVKTTLTPESGSTVVVGDMTFRVLSKEESSGVLPQISFTESNGQIVDVEISDGVGIIPVLSTGEGATGLPPDTKVVSLFLSEGVWKLDTASGEKYDFDSVNKQWLRINPETVSEYYKPVESDNVAGTFTPDSQPVATPVEGPVGEVVNEVYSPVSEIINKSNLSDSVKAEIQEKFKAYDFNASNALTPEEKMNALVQVAEIDQWAKEVSKVGGERTFNSFSRSLNSNISELNFDSLRDNEISAENPTAALMQVLVKSGNLDTGKTVGAYLEQAIARGDVEFVANGDSEKIVVTDKKGSGFLRDRYTVRTLTFTDGKLTVKSGQITK